MVDTNPRTVLTIDSKNLKSIKTLQLERVLVPPAYLSSVNFHVPNNASDDVQSG